MKYRETILRSPSGREVIIGHDRPFTIIGERLNPTNKKKLTAAYLARDFDYVIKEARRQVDAGAHVLDVNVAVGGLFGDEEAVLLKEVVEVLQEALPDVPLCIDSSTIQALQLAVPAYKGKALVNSATAEPEHLHEVMAIVKDTGSAVIGLAQGADGIAPDVEGRFADAVRIIDYAQSIGISLDDVLIDVCTMPLSAIPDSGRVGLTTNRRVVETYGVNTTSGASNVSFGLPARHQLTATYVAMGIAHGFTASIVDPTHVEMIEVIRAADLIMGHDEWAQAYIGYHRRKAAEAAAASGTSA